MKPSQIIPALWEWFFSGAAPPVPFEVFARPGDGPAKAGLGASRTRAALRAVMGQGFALEDGSGQILLEDGSVLLLEAPLTFDSAPTGARLMASRTSASLGASRTSAAIVSPPLTPDMRGGFWLEDQTGHLVLEDGSGRIT